MKRTWVGSVETLWNMQCKSAVWAELSESPWQSRVTSERQNDAGGVGSLSQPGPYVTFGWKFIFLKKAFLVLFCFSDTLKWRLHAALPPSKEITEQSQIQLLDDTSCWRWERVNLVLLCKDWGLQAEKLGDVLFYCWCKNFWRKTDEKLVSAKREKRGQTTEGYRHRIFCWNLTGFSG